MLAHFILLFLETKEKFEKRRKNRKMRDFHKKGAEM